MFFVFLGYYTTFCLVLYISLSVFGHKPLRERGDGSLTVLPVNMLKRITPRSAIKTTM